MGCKWTKTVSTKRLFVQIFENGKVFGRNGDYFLKVPRHQDKLPPKVCL